MRFSIAESFLKKLASTLTRFMLRCTFLGWRTASIPYTSTEPASGTTSVEITRTSVLFPLPFGPRMPTTSPRPTASETESSALTTSPRRPPARRAGAPSGRVVRTCVCAARTSRARLFVRRGPARAERGPPSHKTHLRTSLDLTFFVLLRDGCSRVMPVSDGDRYLGAKELAPGPEVRRPLCEILLS